jgi:hypothetical protein
MTTTMRGFEALGVRVARMDQYYTGPYGTVLASDHHAAEVQWDTGSIEWMAWADLGMVEQFVRK